MDETPRRRSLLMMENESLMFSVAQLNEKVEALSKDKIDLMEVINNLIKHKHEPVNVTVTLSAPSLAKVIREIEEGTDGR